MKKVAVIGSGISGLSLAHELGEAGVNSILIETLPLPGGNTARFSCKATDSCQRCGACLVQDYVSKICRNDRVELLLNCEILDSRQTAKGYELLLHKNPAFIDHLSCSKCGICKKVCPAPKAILVDPFTGSFFINYSECLLSQNMQRSACEQVCPEQAINLELQPIDENLEVDAVALATGFEAFDPAQKPRFGYGRVPGVLSALDLEEMFRNGRFENLQENDRPSSIAFIQCVGSRDSKIGRNYCSRVCCGYAMRSARLLKFKFPEIKVSMFYMDIQTFDRDFENRIDKASQEVNLIRAIPSEIRSGPSGKPEITYYGVNDQVIQEEFDLVSLSVGMGPATTSLAGILGTIEPRADFYGSNSFNPNNPAFKGAFLTGCALGPKTIQESIDDSVHVASQIEFYLNKQQSGVEVE